jgi:hypothetical protein
MCCLPVPCVSFRHLSFEFGAHGFTNAMNGSVTLPGAASPVGQEGSFGFHYGLNWGVPFPFLSQYGTGFQMGFLGTDSNLSGTAGDSGLSRRDQLFITFGAFRRVEWGLQAGLVFDYRHEEFYTETDMWQTRGEVSWLHPCAHEFGFLFAANLQGHGDPSMQSEWRTTDYYAFFYRRRGGPCQGGEGRFYAGWTGNSDGLVGLDLHIPISNHWAIKTGFAYLIPNEGGVSGVINEAWNVPVTFVWYPNGRAQIAKRTCFEPLFGVANNGTFFVDHSSTP